MSVAAARLSSQENQGGGQSAVSTHKELTKALKKKNQAEAIEKLQQGVKNIEILKRLIGSFEELEAVIALIPQEQVQLKNELYFVCGQIFEKSGVPERAFACYSRAGANGYPRALTSEGMCYLKGRGTDISKVNAATSFLKAAMAGHVRGQLNFGVMARDGDGIPKDLDSARYWFHRAAGNESEEGKQLLADLQAKENVGVDYFAQGYRLEKERKFTDSLIAYEAAAKHGNPFGHEKVGIFYLLGKPGVARDPKQAYENFSAGADKGSVFCMYNLAVMLELGDGIDKEPTTALSWYTKAKEGGCKEAGERLTLLEKHLSYSSRKESQSQIQLTQTTYMEDSESDSQKTPIKLEEKEAYKLIDPLQREVEILQEEFRRYQVEGHEIASVQKVFSPILTSAYLMKLHQLQLRNKNPFFSTNLDEETNPELRKKFLKMFEKIAEPHRDPRFKHVSQVLGWHATRREAIPHILGGGFAALRSTDDGWWGVGMYFTQPGYAARYTMSDESGEVPPMIVGKLCGYSPFPVIEGDLQMLKGKPSHGKHDLHVVPVHGQGKSFYACGKDQIPQYWEWVVFEAAQIDPQFLVWVKKIGLPQSIDPPKLEHSKSKKVEKEVKKGISVKK